MHKLVGNTYFYFPWTADYVLTPLHILKKLILSNTNRKVVLFNPEEHDTFHEDLSNSRKEIEKLLKKHNCTLEVWLGDFGFQLKSSKRLKFINWPLFLLYSTCTTEGMIFEDEKSIDKLGVTLNNIAHDFRCEFIDTLAKYNVLEDMYYSWHDEYTIKNYTFKYFKPKKVLLEQYEDLGFTNGAWDQYHVPKVFHKGFIHVINESTVDKLDISEKTWLAIIHKKPFILAGAKNIHSVLTDLGFKLYTDLFDYDFDQLDDYSARLESICSQVAKFKGKNYQDLYDSQLETIDFNYNRLMEIFKTNEGVPEQMFEYIGITDYTDSPIYNGIQENLDKYK
jgi:hypothetical protein